MQLEPTRQGKPLLIIPAFNEGGRIGRVLDQVRSSGFSGDVLVVDDGSADATAAEALQSRAKVVRHPFNLGYGAALQTGYKYALECQSTYVVQMDADGQHDPRNIARLLEPIEAGRLDVVVGSRFLAETGYQMGFLRSLGRKVFSTIARLAGLHVSDPTSGFQAMNHRVLALYADDFFPADYPDVDVLLTAYGHGLRVGEVSVVMSESSRASTLHGGLRSLYYVYKMMLSIWAVSGRRRNRTESTREEETS